MYSYLVHKCLCRLRRLLPMPLDSAEDELYGETIRMIATITQWLFVENLDTCRGVEDLLSISLLNLEQWRAPCFRE